MARIILYGGTFDPIHCGHVAVAEQVMQRVSAGAMWFVLTDTPYLHAAPVASTEDRLRMLRAAIDGRNHFHVATEEVERGGVSFTADTMDQLHARHPSHEFTLLLGADAARRIREWHRAADLLARERFLIVNRTGAAALDEDELRALGYVPQRTQRIQIDSPDVSATEIRRRAAEGEDISGLVPSAVAAIIEQRALYRRLPAVHNAGG
jgi:nicotinate-nucleotide adenylyltransferase